ncbi:MAG: HlyD family efflux transporter periplasmic adaptor subunit [Pararhodobacter sp.]|nr:HlyD family efflux transporter periplasmic adaptor subunit [Pararhodobacter sp.]
MAMARKAGFGLGGLALAGALVWALWPDPVTVDIGQVSRGVLQETVLAEGVTRVREPYAITAPITGMVTRSPVAVGDAVVRGETVVAIMRPADPALMDTRTRAQAEATVAEAEAALRLAETRQERAMSDLDHARTQRDRGRALAERGTIPQRMLDDLEAAHVAAQQGLQAARQELDLNRATLARAQAQLLGPDTTVDTNGDPGECCLRIMAPHSGTVLEVADTSARLVQAGAPLLSIGDVSDLEIEVDLLSADAVRVPAGARATVERWGGPNDLEARVRRVEPAGFTRVSALGIEEQRVRLRLDLLTPPDARNGLGDRFRVFVRLVLWEGDDVLRLPQSALFRHEGGWAVFRLVDGRAQLTPVRIGRQTEGLAEVTAGVSDGDALVLFPPSALADGTRIVARGG